MTYCQSTNRVFERSPLEIAVVFLTDYILEHMDRQMITGAVFIDLLVDHEFLFLSKKTTESEEKSGLVPELFCHTNSKGATW